MTRRIAAAALASVAALWSSAAARAESADAGLKAGDRLAVCGDSITEQHLYSAFIEAYLIACKPVANVTAEQFGWGGETAEGFKQKMPQFMVPFGCTAATTNYGMNDGHYTAMTGKNGDWYRQNVTAVVDRLKQAGVHYIVVGTPGAVDSYTFRNHDVKWAKTYNDTLEQLGKIDKEIAAKEGVGFADVHAAMIDAMTKLKAKYGEQYAFAGNDGVHPGPNGHLVMAYAYLKAMNLNGDVGTITFDGTSQKATATDGHKVLNCSAGTIELESGRYPFCFTGDPAKPDATTGVVQVIPFNDDLNRFKLVATNVGSGDVKVTFGEQSKTFPAADLARGINLAAEFLDNPFSQPFAKVLSSVRAKQDLETAADKNFYNNLPGYKQRMPAVQPQIEAVEKSIRELMDAQAKAVTATVEPVRYTIKVEPVAK